MIEITTSLLFLVSSLYGGVSSVSANTASQAKVDSFQRQEFAEIIKTVNPITFEEYVREYFKDDPILAEIAKCESTFRQYSALGEVIKGRVNQSDVGVMQINKYYHLKQAEKLGYDLHTAEGNMAYAKALYDREGTKPWNSSSKCWKKYAKTDNSKSIKG